MARLSLANRTQWLSVAATIVFTAALTALLAYGMRRASELQSASAALQLASELGSQPQLLRSELTLIQRGLESQTYVGDSLRAVSAGHDTSVSGFRQLSDSLAAAGLQNDAEIAGPLENALTAWQPFEKQLQQLAGIKSADLYADSARGSALTASGLKLKGAVDNLLSAQTRNSRAITDNLAQLSEALRTIVVRNGSNLRLLLLAGTALAAVLLAMMLYFAVRARRAAAAAQLAERQVDNILGTVREGLFLIDRQGRIGAAHSSSLTALLHTPSPAGQSIEDLLRPLVGDKTLLAASKYIKLLWKEKVHEELIESVNPLSQIEVSFTRSQGGRETRYLSFAFRRARDDSDYLLGAVADVTDRVILQQELESLKADSDASGNLLMQLLKVDPTQLDSFLRSADEAFRNCNAVLIEPGKDQNVLRNKLDGVFRELHSVKGEAMALGLEGFAQRVHAAEDVLSTLREQDELAGDQFVPVVTKLDELIGHAADLADVRERVATFRAVPVLDQVPNVAPVRDASVRSTRAAMARGSTATTSPATLEGLLKSLAADVGRALGRSIQLRIDGLELVPAAHAARVKDICLQMVRNAIVHGIEPPEQRAAAGKPPGGTIRVSFADTGGGDYSLLIEDDGQGLSYEGILIAPCSWI
jgi:HPt (histidine-containing phosphotransfer) domain-containing protein